MVLELGIGNKKVYYLNSDGEDLLNRLFERLSLYYQKALHFGDQGIVELNSKSRIFLMDEHEYYFCDGLLILLRRRSKGIYTNGNAYSKQIAKIIASETGIGLCEQRVLPKSHCMPDIIVDFGKKMTELDCYYLIKDMMLQIPLHI